MSQDYQCPHCGGTQNTNFTICLNCGSPIELSFKKQPQIPLKTSNDESPAIEEVKDTMRQFALELNSIMPIPEDEETKNYLRKLPLPSPKSLMEGKREQQYLQAAIEQWGSSSDVAKAAMKLYENELKFRLDAYMGLAYIEHAAKTHFNHILDDINEIKEASISRTSDDMFPLFKSKVESITYRIKSDISSQLMGLSKEIEDIEKKLKKIDKCLVDGCKLGIKITKNQTLLSKENLESYRGKFINSTALISNLRFLIEGEKRRYKIILGIINPFA